MKEILINNDLKLQVPDPIDDVDEIYSLIDGSRATLAKWLPWALTETKEIQQKFLQQNLLNINAKTAVCLGILYQQHYAGLIGLNKVDNDNQSAEIGYWLANQFVGQGIMQAALTKIANYGFAKLKLTKIVLRIAADNQRSNQVASNAGFKLHRIVKNGIKLNDGLHDENEWILLN